MSSRIIEQRQRITTVTHAYRFESRVNIGWGYSFDATNHGAIVISTPEQAASLRDAQAQVAAGLMDEIGHDTYEHSYWEPAVARCDCGAHVYLESFTNECDRCHRLYNMSGQQLNDPRTWEAEDRYAVFGPQNAPEDY